MNKKKVKVIALLVLLGTIQTIQVNAKENIIDSKIPQVKQVKNEGNHYATGIGRSNPTDIVRFSDLYLEDALNDVLGQSRGTDITVAQMESLTDLNIPNKKIEFLNGLEYAQNLKSLNIEGNVIRFTSSGNGDALNELTKLENLNIAYTRFNDINLHIDKLINLKVLNISGNHIADLSFLNNMTNLEELSYIGEVGKNILTDISPLASVTHLKKLYMSDHEIEDISPLSGLTELEDVDLSINRISDLKPLNSAINLKQLNINYNQIVSAKPLENLPNLSRVYMSDNKLINMDGFGDIPNIDVIVVPNNQISDISQISTANTLTDLTADNNQISDLTALSGLPNLSILRMSYNQISDLSPLSSVSTLKDIRMTNNSIEDLNPLSPLTNLIFIKLNSNNIKDISPLSKVNDSVIIHINDNHVEDLSSLSNNVKSVVAKNQQVTKNVVDIHNDDKLEYNVYNQDKSPITLDLGIPVEGMNDYVKSWDNGEFSGTINLSYNYIKSNEKPVLEGTKDISITLGDSVDLLDGVSASDVEDGDLTSNIFVDDTKVDYSKTGVNEVTYTVTDSDGNTATKTINLTIEHDLTVPSDPVTPEVTIPKDGGQLEVTGNQSPLAGLSISLIALSGIFLLRKKTIEN